MITSSHLLKQVEQSPNNSMYPLDHDLSSILEEKKNREKTNKGPDRPSYYQRLGELQARRLLGAERGLCPRAGAWRPEPAGD